MDRITTPSAVYDVARATREDVADIVGLLRDDEIGAGREGTDVEPYAAAFDAVDADPRQLLVIVRGGDGRAAATMQLTFVPGLTRGGATRLIVEGVRVHSSTRGSGLGAAMMAWAHEQGRSRGATIVQLTSDKRRGDAHRFYERLGYVATHEGFKLELGG